MACTASVHLSVGIPDSPSGEAAQIGTAIHALAELCWQTEDDPKNYIDRLVEGICISEENAEFAQLHLDTIKRLETHLGRVLVEQHGTVLNTMQMELSGTCDVVGYSVKDSIIEIVDLKTGRNYVDANSSQLKIYALAMIRKLGEFQIIRLTIVQPQLGANRTVVMTLEELYEWRDKELMPAVSEIATMNAYPTPSKDACKYCPAKLHCPALKEKAAAVPIKPTKELSEDEIAYWLEQADLVEGFYDELRKHATMRLIGGATVPGWNLVQKRAVRKWKDGIDVETLPIDYDLIYKREPITPTQAEKLLSKDDRHLLDDLTEKVSSGITLAKMVESSAV
jgi:RecB family exonuclease